jgi:hypothetical protein
MVIKRNKIHTFSQSSQLGTISTSATLVSAGALAFSLSESALASSFTLIYDCWRIIQVTVRFVPQTAMPTTGAYPPLLTVLDYDDGTTLGSSAVARAYDNLIETPYGNYVERTLTPRTAVATYGGSTFSSYSQSAQWVDAANPATPWYGVKWVIDATANASPAAWALDAEIIYQFRNVR